MTKFTLDAETLPRFSLADADPKPATKDQKRQRYKAAPRNSIKRAKTLTPELLARVLDSAGCSGEHGLRQQVMIRLGFEAGLRAVEISGLRWDKHVLSADGSVGEQITITNDISKKSNERVVPLSKALRNTLVKLRETRPDDVHVIYPLQPRRDKKTGRLKTWVEPNSIVQSLKRFYEDIGMTGVTSHSGRRTFITAMCRKAGTSPHFSLRDAQTIIGHNSLETTAGYIELAEGASRLVDRLYD